MASLGLSSRAIVGRFFRRFEAVMDSSWVGRVVFRESTDQQSEDYKFLDEVPLMTEFTGQTPIERLTSKSITLVNRIFRTGLNISVDDIRRDKTGQIMVRVDELADAAAELGEITLTNLLTGGTGATYGLAYDGQYYFDTDHSEGSSGTQKNVLTSSEVATLNVSSSSAPTQAEMAQAILDSIAYMQGYLSDKGRPINGSARQFILLCPTNLWGPAIAATRSNLLDGASGTSRDNVLRATDFRVDAFINPRLTTTTKAYLLRTDGTTKPFIEQEEVAATVDTSCAEGSEYASQNREHRYTVERICNWGYGQWQHAAELNFS